MSEGSNVDNNIFKVEERCVVNDTLERIKTMGVAELKDELRKRRLRTTGAKEELRDRLRVSIAFEIEYGEDEGDEGEENEEKRDVTEFAKKVDSYNVHKELSRQTKKETETYQEYVCKMFYIAKQVGMENSSVIKYIIDGIRDKETNKMVLYGAKNIRELEKKLILYEAMKENAKTKGKRVEKKFKGMRERRCFLCGNKYHLVVNCPMKIKNVRCFKCQKYGHIASQCK